MVLLASFLRTKSGKRTMSCIQVEATRIALSASAQRKTDTQERLGCVEIETRKPVETGSREMCGSTYRP
jgi:hypothetical protein